MWLLVMKLHKLVLMKELLGLEELFLVNFQFHVLDCNILQMSEEYNLDTYMVSSWYWINRLITTILCHYLEFTIDYLIEIIVLNPSPLPGFDQLIIPLKLHLQFFSALNNCHNLFNVPCSLHST